MPLSDRITAYLRRETQNSNQANIPPSPYAEVE